MPTRKELMEQCKVRGLHGYSRKSKQELEAILAAPPEPEPEPELVPAPPPPTISAVPNATHDWVKNWFADCVGIPPHLRPRFKRPNLTITAPANAAHNDNPQGTPGPV